MRRGGGELVDELKRIALKELLGKDSRDLQDHINYVVTKVYEQAFKRGRLFGKSGEKYPLIDQAEDLLERHEGEWICGQSKYNGIDISSADGGLVLTANYTDHQTCAGICEIVNRFAKLPKELRAAK